MSEFASLTGRTRDHLTVSDDTTTYASADGDVNEIFGILERTEPSLCKRSESSVVTDRDRQRRQPFEIGLHRFAMPTSEVRRVIVSPRCRVDRAGC